MSASSFHTDGILLEISGKLQKFFVVMVMIFLGICTTCAYFSAFGSGGVSHTVLMNLQSRDAEA